MIATSSLEAGVIELAVRDEGEGEPLILLHGFPEDGEAWRAVIACLRGNGFRLIVPDLPGHGASAAPKALDTYRLDRIADCIVSLADRLGVDRFHLIGHDWGSAIGFTAAARHRRRIGSLVAIDAPHPEVLGSALRSDPAQLLRSGYIGFFQLPWLAERLLLANDCALLKRSLRQTSRLGTFSEAELERLAATWQQPGRMTAMLGYYRALRLGIPPIGRIAVPTKILWGGQDRFGGTRLAGASASLCDRARVHVRHTATHWIHREEPDWVAAKIMRAVSPCG